VEPQPATNSAEAAMKTAKSRFAETMIDPRLTGLTTLTTG
jgi:hypothetical protein